MTYPDLRPPVWVSRPEALRRLAGELANLPRIAVDTESNSLYAYRERVCLVQFSTENTDYLVDPLSLSDLSPLASVFANPQIEKVFHAAEYDVICLKRDYGFEFSNLFDTMVASRTLGRENVGLGAVLKECFNVELDKRFQRANWAQRPLPPAQLSYARMDTHFLLALRDELARELQDADRWELAREDFQRLERTPVPAGENGNSFWRVAGSHELTGRQLSILYALYNYRERLAEQANLPPFKILSNQDILQIAIAAPTTMEELAEVDHISPRLRDRYGHGLLQAVEHGQSQEPPRRSHGPRPDERFLARLDALRSWRKVKGREWGVESDVILPKDTMEEIAQANPRNVSELEAIMRPLPYRWRALGEEILRAIH